MVPWKEMQAEVSRCVDSSQSGVFEEYNPEKGNKVLRSCKYNYIYKELREIHLLYIYSLRTEGLPIPPIIAIK